MAAFWLDWIGTASLHLFLWVPVIYLIDKAIDRRTWPGLQTALWAVVLCRLMFPPSALWLPEATASPVPGLSAGALAKAAALEANGRVVALMVVWGVGAGLLALIAVARYGRTKRHVLRSPVRPLPPDVADLTIRSARAIQLRSAPPVFVRDDVRGPFVVGILRPVVIVPSSMVGKRIELEHALLHEFAHVKRRDPLINAACFTLHLVYWFHPLVWIARCRLATLREVACDARAAAASGGTRGYRTTLLHLAGGLVREPGRPVLGLFGGAGQLMTRLAILERPIRRASRIQRAISVALCAVLLVACAVLARPVAATVDPDAIGPAGCLRWRYAVYAALAAEMTKESSR
jgi:beta-lactamase regulating signal transducer with metallopeptidase domain